MSYNSCIDYDKIEASLKNLEDSMPSATKGSKTGADGGDTDVYTGFQSSLEYMSNAHDNCFADEISEFETLESESDAAFDAVKEFVADAHAIVAAFQNAENTGSVDVGKILEGTSLADSMDLGQVTAFSLINLAKTTEDFKDNIAETVKGFISTQTDLSDFYPDDYESVGEWKEALVSEFKKQGYTEEEAIEKAESVMSYILLEETGAEVASFAEQAESSNEELDLLLQQRNALKERLKVLEEKIENSTNPLDQQRAEQQYAEIQEDLEKVEGKLAALRDTSTDANTDSSSVDVGDSSDSSSDSSSSSSESSDSSSSSSSSSSYPGSSSSSDSSDTGPSKVSYRKEDNSDSSVVDKAVEKVKEKVDEAADKLKDTSISSNDSSLKQDATLDQPQNSDNTNTLPNDTNNNQTSTGTNNGTNSNNTGTNTGTTPGSSNNGNHNTSNPEVPSTGNNDTSVPETPTNDNNVSINEPPSIQQQPQQNPGASAQPPVNNSNNTITYTPQDSTQSNTTSPEATPLPDESTNVSGTTDTNDIPSSDGEDLDIISIDKTTPSGSSTVSTASKSSDGGSAIPIILGVAAAGAAAVAGGKYIKNKKEKENDNGEDDNYQYEDNNLLGTDSNDATVDSSYEAQPTSEGNEVMKLIMNSDDQKEDNSSAPAEDESADFGFDRTTQKSNKYQAGSINKLSLEDGRDVRIEDDVIFGNQKEELE